MLYHENLFVRFRSTNKNLARVMNIKGISFFLEGRKAEIFSHCSMSVDIDRLSTPLRVKSQEDKSCYVIASTDVQLLCESLLIQHTVISGIFKKYEIRITIHRMFDDMLTKIPAQNSPQRHLLEPLTTLHSVSHFRIAGPANSDYCASIAAQVSRVGPTVIDYFNQVIELRAKGHAYISRNDLKDAIKAYKMAFSLLISTCLRCRIVGLDWTDFHPDLPGTVVETYLALEVSLAFSHYSLDEWEDAHFWACNASEYGPRKNYDNCYARLIYVKAIASARLGKHEQAIKELCEGLKFVNRELYKDKQLVAIRREARYQIKGLGGIEVLKAMGIGYL